MKHVSQSAKRLGFHIHAAGFVVGMGVITLINLLTGPPYWVLWVLLGWGLGILSHGLCVMFSGSAQRETT
ncbi:MAG: 2TM domain-containing protein [Acidobacteria bacterium]|nr:2TM domain-containing protein [Acidobacteriota bacterium]